MFSHLKKVIYGIEKNFKMFQQLMLSPKNLYLPLSHVPTVFIFKHDEQYFIHC